MSKEPKRLVPAGAAEKLPRVASKGAKLRDRIPRWSLVRWPKEELPVPGERARVEVTNGKFVYQREVQSSGCVVLMPQGWSDRLRAVHDAFDKRGMIHPVAVPKPTPNADVFDGF